MRDFGRIPKRGWSLPTWDDNREELRPKLRPYSTNVVDGIPIEIEIPVINLY